MNRYQLLTLAFVVTVGLAACSAPTATTLAPTTGPASTSPALGATFTRAAASTPATGAALTVTSTAFTEGANIPRKYTCQGESVSPQVEWSGAPAETQSFALFLEDPDAPSGTFYHWIAFDIPRSVTKIDEGAQQVGKSGKNSAGKTGYIGPCPPSGTHRYIFTIYALDVSSVNLSAGATRDQVVAALKGHILAQGQLMGRYAKQ